ncbi:hypothetical protein LTR70_000917 [Exophiala xenobiotica]|uniref:NACHT domain-containing protein n=1 Tax=Lithohypha guttulata TaxID=1690604 RepID=A0ABR0KK43_9EURO|nr:hypothetical protein LTR24_001590 [Lithohypha guttulata]KAK5329081.1 hypothetical protein LTR70_000917 [Exophiala xenobiotica]
MQFYFWLHGTELQRSLRGCLCTILNQILVDTPELAKYLIRENTSITRKRSVDDWSLSELRAVVFAALKSIPGRFAIFLDGLDEFDSSSDARELLDLLHGLSNTGNAKVCVSSRPEAILEAGLAHMPRMQLHYLTFDDMVVTARNRLTLELQNANMPSLSEESVAELAQLVADMAEGIFLWALTAIKSLSSGIHRCDDIHTLHRRLSILPRDMRSLYGQMWKRLQDDQPLYQEESDFYFALRDISPCSLLVFTLASNQHLVENCMSLHAPANLLSEIAQECRSMQRRIHARTAGLLEVVDVVLPTPTHLPTSTNRRTFGAQHQDKSRRPGSNAMCECGLQPPEGHQYSPVEHDAFRQLWTVGNKEVQYIHRSVVEFLGGKFTETCDSQEPAHSEDAPDGNLVDQVSRALRPLPETDSCDIVLQLMAFGETASVNFRAHACAYGWDHELFNGINHSEDGMFNSAGSCGIELFLDIPGLMASHGNLTYLRDHFNSQPEQPSSYYKGHLLVCAATGLYDDFENDLRGQAYLRRAQTISWLVDIGADLLTPQLCIVPNSWSVAMLPRPPLVECWLFISRLINHCRSNLTYMIACIGALVTKLLGQEAALESKFIWSISNQAFVDVSVPCACSHDEETDFLWMLQTTLGELQDYVMGLIRRFQRRGSTEK